MRKDVSQVPKKINAINKELKPLGHTCQKKVTQLGFLPHSDVNVYCYAYAIMDQFVSVRDEFRVCNLSQEKEYRDALEAFNEKNREKVQLITKLMEVSLSQERE